MNGDLLRKWCESATGLPTMHRRWLAGIRYRTVSCGLFICLTLAIAVSAFGTDEVARLEVTNAGSDTAPAPSGVIVGDETVLTDTSDSDFAAVIVDDAGDSHLVTRDANTGALRYLKIHAERIALDEVITPAASAADRQKHQAGMILAGTDRPVVWSAGHQFVRDAGSGQWSEIDASIGCESMVVFKGQLLCLAVVPGKKFDAPKHWVGGIIGGPGAAVPFAWRVNTDTLALFGEEHNLWQPQAVIDRDSKTDASGPYYMAVDVRDRLHILSTGFFHHALYPEAGDAPQPTPADAQTTDAPRRFGNVVSAPVALRFKPPYGDGAIVLSVSPGLWMPGPSLDAVWSRSRPAGVAFDPESQEFTLLQSGWNARGKTFSMAPDTWIQMVRLKGHQAESVQNLVTYPDGYMDSGMAQSSHGKLHAVIVRTPKDNGPKTVDYFAYDGRDWSSPMSLSQTNTIQKLYGIAANRTGQVLIVFSTPAGKLVTRSIIDRPPATSVSIPPEERESVPNYQSKPGGMGLVVPIALSDLGVQVTAGAGTPVKVKDRRSAVVMERTALGRPMGLVGLEPNERELVAALVTDQWQQALRKRGLSTADRQFTCELQDFSITTPGTMLYWDVSVRVQWVLHLADQQRIVTATSKHRTFAWPSETLIRQVTLEAMKSASAQTEKAIGELLGPPTP